MRKVIFFRPNIPYSKLLHAFIKPWISVPKETLHSAKFMSVIDILGPSSNRLSQKCDNCFVVQYFGD